MNKPLKIDITGNTGYVDTTLPHPLGKSTITTNSRQKATKGFTKDPSIFRELNHSFHQNQCK